MAEDSAEQTAKLQLDEETGEMVSKNELKKRMQKRAKKAVTAASRNSTLTPAPKPTPGDQERAGKPANIESTVDPDAMFKQGCLADVYKLRPSTDVVTRFPPEPNGYLHLGHAKAIAVNFGFARHHGGKTILRFHDTNPDAEKEEYFVAIKETIRWLGFTPFKITYASDNFQRMYDLAEELIKKEKAYFRGMRDGEYAPQTAWLRMKQDIENPNPQMWDIAAYRIPKNQEPHFRTGTKWRIYPTYDFAHCLRDSLEGITHSLCTTEFIMSRESYEWLNKLLVDFQPMQREYGRLELNGTFMSKRDLKELIDTKTVRGWDDPRLYTLQAIRRRGIPPGALLLFLHELGVTTSTSSIDIKRFEQSDAEEQDLDIPFSPKDPEMGSYKIRLPKMVYIDRSDFREMDSKDYFRLAPGKVVGLLQMPYPVRATSFTKDDSTGSVKEVRAAFVKEGKKPKTYIQWSAPGGFMNDVNPESETVWPNAMIETGFYEVRQRAPWPEAQGEKTGEVGPESVRFQAMRVAYFALDSDSTDDKIVLNRIVPLKEDSGKTS
ncbi:hypothetical protein VMCG_05699 [Cytospora schulzeri]|uniref:glutamine--tRNA ligase n=1 Tax=Cytospora schulzeri TaxID=448051 RepID=A0A423WHZ9_9PEZI|nr:hypothetical protein VMCG_05699 [Valsa malicola]